MLHIIMYRDISDDDFMAEDDCVYASYNEQDAERAISVLQCDAAEFEYYYMFSVAPS